MMKNNKCEYEKRAVIAINKIFEFIKTKDHKLLTTIKSVSKELNLYMLLSFFQSNLGYFDDILYSNLENIFEMKKYQKMSSNFLFDEGEFNDYGSGIITNSKDDYHKQMKHIRNALAHNDFDIDDNGNIIINNEVYEAIIDPKWLQALLFAVLSSKHNGIANGMEEGLMYAYNPPKHPSTEEIKTYVKNGMVGNIEIRINTNSIPKLEKVLGLPNGVLTEFDQIYELIEYYLDLKIKELSNRENQQEYINTNNLAIKALNEEFQGIITLTKKPLKYEEVEDLIDNPLFKHIDSYADQMQLMFYHNCKNDKIKVRIHYCFISEVLYKLENNIELKEIDYLYLEEAKEFLINTFGALVFGNIIENNGDFLYISRHIYQKYEKAMNEDYAYAKNHYKELLKQLNGSLSEYDKYGSPLKMPLSELQTLIETIEKRNEEVVNNNTPLFFIKMRNIFAHGYLEIKNGIIHLFDKEPPRRFMRYSKSKKRWDEKFSKQELTYNNYIDLEVFLRMLNDICSIYMLEFDAESKRFKVNEKYKSL